MSVRDFIRMSDYQANLTPESRAVLSEAAMDMNQWVDSSIDAIGKTMRERLDASVETAKAEIAAEVATLKKDQDELFARIDAVQVGDAQALNDLKAKVREYLSDRETRLTGVGEKIAKVAIAAGKRAIGV